MFEFDPAKSAANKAKHGIDFEAAQALWKDGDRIEAAARSIGELRHIAVGRITGKIWCVIFTMRNSKIRIISARRAREGEIRNYEHAKKAQG